MHGFMMQQNQTKGKKDSASVVKQNQKQKHDLSHTPKFNQFSLATYYWYIFSQACQMVKKCYLLVHSIAVYYFYLKENITCF